VRAPIWTTEKRRLIAAGALAVGLTPIPGAYLLVEHHTWQHAGAQVQRAVDTYPLRSSSNSSGRPVQTKPVPLKVNPIGRQAA